MKVGLDINITFIKSKEIFFFYCVFKYLLVYYILDYCLFLKVFNIQDFTLLIEKL